MSVLNEADLQQHVVGPTHVLEHTLDLVITPVSGCLVTSTSVSTMMSDHNWIHTTLCNQKPVQSLKDITVSKYKSIDRANLQQDILSSALRQDHADECEDDCDDLYNQYHNTLTQLLDKHAPPAKELSVSGLDSLVY